MSARLQQHGEKLDEQHEQWVGLDFVERNGLPGYPLVGEPPKPMGGAVARHRPKQRPSDFTQL